MSDTEEQKSNKHTTARVSVKIPPFDSTNLKMWIRILESQFKLGAITTSSTKFHHLLSNIPMSLISKIPDKILDDENYDNLKAELLTTYEKSKHERFDEFINKIVLDDKPSVFLREIQKAAHDVGVSEDIVRRRFEKVLPPNISPVIAAQPDVPLNQIGKLADDLMNLCASVNSANAVNNNNNSIEKKINLNQSQKLFLK